MNLSNRIAHIDRLKGLAILVMIIGHVYLFVLDHREGLINKTISCNMPLFMFLSGVVLSVPLTYRKWYVKVIQFMSPAIFAGISCYLLLDWNSATHTNLTDLLLIPSQRHWYLISLTLFYSTVFLIGLIKRESVIIDILLFCFFYILFFFCWKNGGIISKGLCLEHCTCFYPFFMMGYLMKKYLGGTSYLLRYNVLFTVSLLLCLFLMFNDFEMYVIRNIVKRFLFPACTIIVIVILFAKRETKSSKIESTLAVMGRNSLDIYIWHFLFLHCFNLNSLKFIFKDNTNPFIELIIALLISIIISYTALFLGKLLRQSDFIRKYFYGEWTKK